MTSPPEVYRRQAVRAGGALLATAEPLPRALGGGLARPVVCLLAPRFALFFLYTMLWSTASGFFSHGRCGHLDTPHYIPLVVTIQDIIGGV
jgi:hypothetical protein